VASDGIPRLDSCLDGHKELVMILEDVEVAIGGCGKKTLRRVDCNGLAEKAPYSGCH
jgi:hypothetical protein